MPLSAITFTGRRGWLLPQALTPDQQGGNDGESRQPGSTPPRRVIEPTCHILDSTSQPV